MHHFDAEAGAPHFEKKYYFQTTPQQIHTHDAPSKRSLVENEKQ
jgi:hypothetical protein